MVNCIMLAEIKRTAEEKIVPLGSKIKGSWIWAELYDKMVQDNRIVLL